MFMVLCMTAGTAFVMWLAELITQRGVGQGMSLLIFANVVAQIPSGMHQVLEIGGWVKCGVLIVISVMLLVFIIFMDQGQRRIPVTFARRMVGRRMTMGQSTYIPFKVNQSGVVPIIFASSILYIPYLISNIVPWTGYQDWVRNNLANPTSTVYIALYFVLIFAFTFFYVYIIFEPHQQAELIRKQGGSSRASARGPPRSATSRSSSAGSRSSAASSWPRSRSSRASSCTSGTSRGSRSTGPRC